jgi:type I restriction enzyme S subunit
VISGWKEARIDDVCAVVNGATPKTAVSAYWGGDVAWITPAEMGKRLSPYVEGTERTLTESGLESCSARLLPPYSVIMSSRAPIGHLVINTAPMATNQGCKGLVPSSALEHKYLYYYLSSIVDVLDELGSGATFRELSSEKLKAVSIPVPPLAEQRRIVGLLDATLEDIAIAMASAERNLSNAQALFGSHLNFVFSQSGSGWVSTTLETVLDQLPRNGWSPPAANHSESGTPVLTLSSVTGFRFRPEKVKFTSAPTMAGRSYWVGNGDLLISRSNTPNLVGHVAIASGITVPTIYPDLIMRMKPAADRVMTEFLYYQMRTSELRREITSRAKGANPTMKKISNGDVRSLPIVVPPISEQREVVDTLNALNRETQQLEGIYRKKLEALRVLKKSLLHRAVAGER